MAIVLLYHRVASPRTDPWALAVSPEHFSAHLAVLKKHTRIVTIDDIVAALAEGRPLTGAVALTFDDGYSDVFYEALPRLESLDVPATFYVPSDTLGSHREFWWDELEHLLLSPRVLPDTLSIDIDGDPLDCDLRVGTRSVLDSFQRAVSWRAWEPPPTPRHALYQRLWTRLHAAGAAARDEAMEQLRRWSMTDGAVRATHRTLTEEQALSLSRSSLASIGGHTRTHPRLASLPKDAQRAEIEDNKRHLEAVLATQMKSFSYPFGKQSDYSRETVGLVKAAGYSSACCNWPGVVAAEADPFELPRFFVTDRDGADFERWLVSVHD